VTLSEYLPQTIKTKLGCIEREGEGNMRMKVEFAISIMFILSFPIVGSALAQVGVSTGDTFTYSMKGYWYPKTQGTQYPILSEINQTEWLSYKITESPYFGEFSYRFINGTKISFGFYMTDYEDNSAKIGEIGLKNISDGSSYLHDDFIGLIPLFPANMSIGGYTPYSGGQGYPISNSIESVYPDCARTVNHCVINYTQGDANYRYKNIDLYFDQKTGAIIEFNSEYYQNPLSMYNTPEGKFIIEVKLQESNVWRVSPTPSPSLSPSPSPPATLSPSPSIPEFPLPILTIAFLITATILGTIIFKKKQSKGR
jgi:hypothetical protein